ncbi:transmembrane protein 42 [Prorops nasuta]|uniref:transmembrane protein 42 n=1 Tax=Prorops nasuta TaxID=863751 RepID=UPI0034CEBB13
MENNKSWTVYFSIFSGVFATTGSLLGKLAGGAEYSPMDSLLLKAVLLVLMIVSNTIGCTFFVKALHESGSSLPATIVSTSTNYFCSALIGFLAFGESTSLSWWLGTSLVLLGLVIICKSQTDEESTKLKAKQN